MIRVICINVACLGMVLVHGCRAVPPAVVTVGVGTTAVQAAVGDEVNVQLAENPSTGWTWRLQSPLNGILHSEDDRFIRSTSPGTGLIGAGGTRIFSFAAIAEGTVELEYALAGPGRDVQPSDHRMTFTVRVTR
jgi:predicted secreted protein